MFSSAVIQSFTEKETPFYYYDLSLLRETLSVVQDLAKQYDYDIHYAVKANSNQKILQEIRDFGLGIDCVSGNEIRRCIESGFKGEQVLFAGVGKTDKEIEYAIQQNIQFFNCESIEEIGVINEIAGKMNRQVGIAIRINPNVDAKTHRYITTGTTENKFGIEQKYLPEIIQQVHCWPYVNLIGIHFHIGSQITDLSVFESLCTRVNEIQDWLEQQSIKIKHLNLGGGLGIDYQSPDTVKIADFQRYFEIFNRLIKRREGQKIHFELGRSIVGQCGSLISRVLYVKKGITTNFVILDAGMTELMRPALYQSYHQIDNLSSQRENSQPYDVVGPICESSDCFGRGIRLPETQRGDLIAIRSAGAYGEVMQSSYNLRTQNSSLYT
ncbi:MAG: diaminopimelate decarboxylase [Gammaproteobacteria bacterium]|nr:diaminopimelate decarboxylase [Gammaproteobacteria bacterium]MDH5629236.1 diaminopimelate decarboxylase [Gammaproteobacteria bacterium]